MASNQSKKIGRLQSFWCRLLIIVSLPLAPHAWSGATNLVANADAMICSGWPTNNFGSYSNLVLGYTTNSDAFPDFVPLEMKVIAVFNLETALPQGLTASNIHEARLKFVVTASNLTNEQTVLVQARLVTNAWHEMEITWSNQPGAESVIASATWAGTNQDLELLLPTDIVQQWINNPSNNYGLELSLVLAEGEQFFLRLASREDETKPVLEVSYTEPAFFSITGQVRSRNWPFAAVSGASITADSGQTTLSLDDGSYALTNLPVGVRQLTALRADYEGAENLETALQTVELTTNLAGLDFTNFACRAVPQVSIVLETNIINPGQTVWMQVILQNNGPDVASVPASLAFSCSLEAVSIGAPVITNWDGEVIYYPPGSSLLGLGGPITNSEPLIIATRTNAPWARNQSYSFAVPLTAHSALSTGTVTLKYRGMIGDRLDPPGPDWPSLDEPGWPAWSTNLVVVKPFELLAHTLSTNTVRDGQTITVGYEIYSPFATTGWLGCRLERTNHTTLQVIEDETHQPPLAPGIELLPGTNWYYRDFFVNLGPQDSPGVYDVSLTVHTEAGEAALVMEPAGLNIEPPLPTRVPILMYHQVAPVARSFLWVTTPAFEAQMRALKAYGYTAITLQEWAEARAGLRTLPPKPVVLTFDDGHITLLTDVYPVLTNPAVAMKATSFIITGKVGQDASWTYDYTGRQLAWEEIELLHQSGRIDFQSHGANHPHYYDWTNQHLDLIAADLADSKRELETRLGKTVQFLAYPYGDTTTPLIQQMVRNAGYFAAIIATGGTEVNGVNKYLLRRIAVTSNSSLEYDPESPEDWFFEFDESIPQPKIGLQRVEYVDAITGEVLADNAALPGQQVVLRLHVTNAEPGVNVIASLQLATEPNPTNGLAYDSHACNPAEDQAKYFAPGPERFEWTWTVPTNAAPVPYFARFRFHDTNYLLGFRDFGWQPAITVLPPLQVTNVSIALGSTNFNGTMLQGYPLAGQGIMTGVSRGTVQYEWHVRQPDGAEWSSASLSVVMSNGTALLPVFDQLPTSLVGEHTVWVRVLSPGEPTDAFSTVATYTVLEAIPDLAFLGELQASPSGLNAGEAVRLQISLQNLGDKSVTNDLLLRAVLSGSSSPNTNYVLGERVLGSVSLPPLATMPLPEWELLTPAELATGDYSIAVVIDPENALREQSKTNNWASVGLHIEELRPDLEAVSVALAGPIDPSEHTDVAFALSNVGTAPASNFTCKVVLSTDPAIDDSDVAVGDFQISHMERNASVSGIVNVTMPGWLEPTTNYYLGLIVDPAGVPPNSGPGEVLERAGQEVTNNTVAQLVVWQPPPPPVFDVARSSHQPGQWSTNHSLELWWEAPAHVRAIAGYSVLLDESPTNVPTRTVNATNLSITANITNDTDQLYLHVRAWDELGQWGGTAHFGPFQIDSTAPGLPVLLSPVGDTNIPGLQPQFAWRGVTDNLSAVSYDLKVLQDVEVDGELVRQEVLGRSNLWDAGFLPDMPLPAARLFWAVRASDAAGNQTDWTPWAAFTPMSALGAVDLSVPYYEQNKYGHGWGWLAGAAMLLNYYGVPAKPWQIAAELQQPAEQSTSVPELVLWLGSNSGISNTWEHLILEPTSTLIPKLAPPLSAGHPVLVGRTPEQAWSWPPPQGSDALLVVGYAGLNLEDAVYYHDPAAAVAYRREMERSLSWREFIELLKSKWRDAAEINLVYAQGTNVPSGTMPATLSLLPGSAYRHAGLSWHHWRNGTNYRAELQWDGRTNFPGGYYFVASAPEEFPEADENHEDELHMAAASACDTLIISPSIANSSARTNYVRVEGQLRGASNELPIVTFDTGPLYSVAPYSFETPRGLQVTQSLALPEMVPGVYLLELVLKGNRDGGEQLESWDTNQFSFVLAPWPQGNLQVLLDPELATNSGAAWRVDDGAWQTSGATLGNLAAGTHWLEFQSVSNWLAPTRELVTITEGQTSVVSRAYVYGENYLQVWLGPDESLAAGAQWRLEGGEWRDSGAALALNPGEYLVEYKSIPGWVGPTNEVIRIRSNRLAEITRQYVQQTGALRISLLPEAAGREGAAWQLDGMGPWRQSGETLLGLPVGTHTVAFAPLAGWSAPAGETVLVTEGTTNELTCSYVPQTGSITIMIAPPEAVAAGAQWRIDNGAWLASGQVQEALLTGYHAVEFQSISGWQRPATRSVRVEHGQTSTVSVVYVQKVLPSILQQPESLTRVPGDTAQFMVAAAGTEPLSYEWYRDGAPLADSARMAGTAGPELTLNGLELADAGDFSVVVCNTMGCVTSAVARLAIYEPAVIVRQPQSQTAQYQQPVVLSVAASGSALTYQWLKDGAELADDLRIQGAQSNVLAISAADLADAGQYLVVIANPLGSTTSELVELTVAGYVQAQIQNAPAGGIVALPAGRFFEHMVIDKDITLQGAGMANTILDGRNLGRVITISSNATVCLQELAVQNGRSGAGGGIWNGGSLRLTSVLLTNNTADEAGAILNSNQLVLDKCTLAGNAALAGAGGLGNFGTLALTNCTLSGNTSETGVGGLFNALTAWLESCTICSNRSTAATGGVENSGALELRNDLVAGNLTANTNLGADLAGQFASAGYNLISDTNGFSMEGHNNLFGVNPLLGPLRDNGGPTPTHALLLGSPAIDRGSPAGPATDQRGLSRPAGSPASANAASADIGAFEFQYDAPGNITNQAGESVTFNIAVTGDEPLYYQWRFNGVDLADGGIVAGANTATLTLANVKPYQAGLYSVVVTNSAGSLTSQVELTVSLPAPVLTTAHLISSGNFMIRFTGVPNRSYALQQTLDFTNWTLLTMLTNVTGEVQEFQMEATTAEPQYYRAKLEPLVLSTNSNPGPFAGSAVRRDYEDGYVRVDSLGNPGGLTYYWGYETSDQATNGVLALHARIMLDQTVVGLITDRYYFGEAAPPAAPYHGSEIVPDPPDPERSRLPDAPFSRTISFY